MRLSVSTGVLACAVIFLISTAPVSASTSEPQQQKQELRDIAAIIAEKEDSEVTVEEVLEQMKQEAQQTDNEEQEKKDQKPVVHLVKEGETLSDIAKQHETTWRRLYDKNTAIEHPDVILVDMKVTIPTAEEELETRPLPEPAPVQQVAESTSDAGTTPRTSDSTRSRPQASSLQATSERTTQSTATTRRGSSSGNRYAAGYCTWYVKNMRPDLPNNLGNARTWAIRARAQGMSTGATPRVGAVGQRGNHVVYVQSVNNDGTVTFSEMNYRSLYTKTVRTVPANYFTYIY